MTIPRIFVSYAFSGGTQREDQFTPRLVNDLRAAGADVIVDEASSTNEDLAQSLNHTLPGCHWLVLVQTPASLHSPRVQLAVNTALNLVVQGRMQGVLRVITEPCGPGEVPPTWTTLNLFDASKDYPRALTRLLLALGLVGQPKLLQNTMKSYDVLQSSASHVSPQRSSIDDRPVPLSSEPESIKKSAIPSPVQFDRPLSPPALPSSPQKRFLSWSSPLLVLAISIVLIIVSIMIVYSKSNQNRPTVIPVTTTSRTQAITTATLYVKPGTPADPGPSAKTTVTPHPNATATTVSHSTPSSSPTKKVALSPTPISSPPTTPISPPTTPTSPPATPISPPTHAETTGGDAHTWTNYTNAGGYEGPTIPSNATVQIACKIAGFVVADGNPWWYRIASSPWNNAYYVSADAFYNNGQTSGSLQGTPFVDPNVPNC